MSPATADRHDLVLRVGSPANRAGALPGWRVRQDDALSHDIV